MAERNFRFDPEAALSVLKYTRSPITLATDEVCSFIKTTKVMFCFWLIFVDKIFFSRNGVYLN